MANKWLEPVCNDAEAIGSMTQSVLGSPGVGAMDDTRGLRTLAESLP